MNRNKIYRSGLVQRFHQNPEMAMYGQTNAAHQWGVAVLVLMLFKRPSRELMQAALTHDIGEIDCGDIANPFKQKNREFTKIYENLEYQNRQETLANLETTAYLNSHEEKQLKLCDTLEAILFVKLRNPSILNRGGWPEAIESCLSLASHLDCTIAVKDLLDGN